MSLIILYNGIGNLETTKLIELGDILDNETIIDWDRVVNKDEELAELDE